MTLQLELKLLQDTRALIANEKNWCKETFHKSGGFLRPERYCLVGALDHVSMVEAEANLPDPISALRANAAARERLDWMAYDTGRGGAMGFNDAPRTTHRDVLWLLDMAITRCKQDLSRQQAKVETRRGAVKRELVA